MINYILYEVKAFPHCMDKIMYGVDFIYLKDFIITWPHSGCFDNVVPDN